MLSVVLQCPRSRQASRAPGPCRQLEHKDSDKRYSGRGETETQARQQGRSFQFQQVQQCPPPDLRPGRHGSISMPLVLVFPDIQAYGTSHCRHSDVIFSRLTLTSSNVSGNRISSITLSRPRSQREKEFIKWPSHTLPASGFVDFRHAWKRPFPFRRNEPSSSST